MRVLLQEILIPDAMSDLMHHVLATGTQIVPAIMPYVASVAHVSRSVPWHRPAMNFPYNPVVRWILTRVPFSRRLLRWALALVTEVALRDASTKEGTNGRTRRKMQAVAHIHKTAPTKYHKILIPEFELGCKVCASGLPVIYVNRD